ncbi:MULTISPECIES: aminotransferase class IV [unclassified Carboxylicivirga]|uniref:aminotransferase class IV n=1 Tax=Carboxylicivirga TaxID=1628153 RepID=UPI003D334110
MNNSERSVLLNGIIKSADEAILSSSNRAFRYGDALFETMRCVQLKALWFNDHYQRLLNGMALLKMDIKSLPTAYLLQREISKLVRLNKIYGDARIRLSVFREDGGLYTPQSNRVNWLIEASPLATSGYTLNTKGLLTTIYQDETKAIKHLGQFKSANALFFVLAGLYKAEQGLDDVLIMNEHHQIIEGLASNLFWVHNDQIYTPLRSSGCVDGIMRKQVIRLLRADGYTLHEVAGTDEATLMNADEIFLSNAIQGIQWVVGLNEKRYFCRVSKTISRLLNKAMINYTLDSPENSSRP